MFWYVVIFFPKLNKDFSKKAIRKKRRAVEYSMKSANFSFSSSEMDDENPTNSTLSHTDTPKRCSQQYRPLSRVCACVYVLLLLWSETGFRLGKRIANIIQYILVARVD